jgi:AmmeMemoRadiSam system protein B
MKKVPSVRPSPIAGSWYSGDPKELSTQIERYIKDAAPPDVNGNIIGLISPHAGYFYSGATAGYAYQCVQGKTYDICVVLSPLHDYQPFDLLTSAHSAYSTPLGEVPIAVDLVAEIDREIQQSSESSLEPISNDREHSLEIQLPFLQVALAGDFRLIPIMVRSHSPVLLQKAAHAISKILTGRKVLVVASTDLSHFYPQLTAVKFDNIMIEHFTAFSPQGVLEAEHNQQAFACGAGAVALALWTTQLMGAKNVTLLHHSTSADASGETNQVVGYAAAAISD